MIKANRQIQTCFT